MTSKAKALNLKNGPGLLLFVRQTGISRG